MANIYIYSYSKQGSGTINVNLDSLIVLQVVRICNTKNITVNVLQNENDSNEPLFRINSDLHSKFVEYDEVPSIANFCKWPVIVVGNTVIAGLASVSRQIIKSSKEEQAMALLGFREACLMACNETSIWTKFCEIDMIATIGSIFKDPENYLKSDTICIPTDLSRYEAHMTEPVRVHNVYKLARIKNNDKLIKSSVPIDQLNLDHIYSEGPFMTLADLLLFPCFDILFKIFGTTILENALPLTSMWYEHLQNDLKDTKIDFNFFIDIEVPLPDAKILQEPIKKQSLYKADPKRYKPQNRIYTKQIDIDNALGITADLSLANHHEKPFGCDTHFSWDEIPIEANPVGGALPETRANRKCQQLENLAKAVVAISENKDYKIVDFCSGSGHLGILVATLLPKCHVILVENKEKSLQRAQDRINKMNLTNVSLVQSNLDYFVAKFDVGMALHACGVATDLVIQSCIKNEAHFICCPCCYGGIHDCHHLTYPRSKIFQNTSLTYRDYLIIGHSADQTHDKDNAKTAQGFICMNVIDTDRKLQAEECGYSVYLGKLLPPSCTPKNNLLVGIVNSVK